MLKFYPASSQTSLDLGIYSLGIYIITSVQHRINASLTEGNRVSPADRRFDAMQYTAMQYNVLLYNVSGKKTP